MSRPNRLKHLRTCGQKYGCMWLTLEEVATLTGQDFTTVSRHESGRGVSPEALEKYAKLYKVETYEILVDPDTLSAESKSA